MKMRNGFVSNSSSASFVVALSALNKEEQCKVLDYGVYPDVPGYHDSWAITKDNDYIFGWSSMDNSDFSNYLGESLSQKLKWESDY